MQNGLTDALFSDRCIACNTNCATCITLPEKCVTCPEGTQLMGSSCAGMYTVAFTYEVSSTFEVFL